MGKKKTVVPNHLQKFYNRRYELFSKFDEGIQLNEQQWYSVTPESIARVTSLQIAHRFPGTKTVLDLFGGAGGNAIQFALLFDRVVYNEIDDDTVKLAQINAGIYGVDFEIYQSNFYDLTSDDLNIVDRNSTVMFLSPPWGGPKYLKQQVWSLDEEDGEKMSVVRIMEHAKTIADNFCLFLPKTANLEQIATLLPKGGLVADVEYVHSNGFCNGICVYFGPGMISNTYKR